MKTIPLLIGILLLSACGHSTVVRTQPVDTATPSSASALSAAVDNRSSAAGDGRSSESSPSSPSSLAPSSLRLSLPFATQAPLGNWDMPYQEACEEASLILVRHYLEQTTLGPQEMDQEILALVAEEEARGLPPDITMPQLAALAEDVYGYETELLEGSAVTENAIVSSLAAGLPVIVPLAGQRLGNPYYSGDGPPYHVFVIVGYDERHFITHDVGTRHGAYYAYARTTVMNALHDWTGSKETIEEGPKRMLIVRKRT